MTPPAKPGELFFLGGGREGAAGGQRFAALQKGREISKMWENARKLLPGMGDLGENAEIGVDKWEECGIICISAGVLLL